jgi:hypothetical protein
MPLYIDEGRCSGPVEMKELNLLELPTSEGAAFSNRGIPKLVTSHDGREFLVKDAQSYQNRLERLHYETSRPGNFFLREITAPIVFPLAAFQTTIRNQLNRGNCLASDGVAAPETGYKRKYNLGLALSEQSLWTRQASIPARVLALGHKSTNRLLA